MPSNLHYFLNDYLQLFRLNFDHADIFQFDDEEIEMTEYDDLPSDQSYLTPLLSMCGYKRPFSSNLITILILLAALISGVILLHFIAKLRKTETHLAPKICNFSLRYGYEFLLEVFLSMLIFTATMNTYTLLEWVPVLITLSAVLAFVVFLLTRFFVGGPFVPKSYKPGTMLDSYWSIRPLNDSILTSDLVKNKP